MNAGRLIQKLRIARFLLCRIHRKAQRILIPA
jgi:hypothetical protein